MAEIKVLTPGMFRGVFPTLIPEFERGSGHQRSIARHLEQQRGLDHEKRPKSFASAEACVTHGVKKPRRPGNLAIRRR